MARKPKRQACPSSRTGSSKHAALDLHYLQKTDFISSSSPNPFPEYIKVSRIYSESYRRKRRSIHSDPEGILPRPMEPTGHNHQLPTVSPTPGGEKELLGRT